MYINKRGQITIFIILAILITGGIVSFFVIQNSGSTEIDKFSGNMSYYVTDSIQSCLENTSLLAIDFYGLKETEIKSYVEGEVVACINKKLKSYIDGGSVSSRLNNISVVINEEMVSISMDYPTYVNSSDLSFYVSNFNVGFDLFSSEELSINSACALEYDANLFSFDNKFSIYVPRGTVVKNKNGSCASEINLKIEDSASYYGSSSMGLTSLVYIPGPKGTEFGSPAELKLYYSDLAYERYVTSPLNSNKLLETEDKLSLSYFDNIGKEYYLYPNENGLNSSVNSDENYIFAETKIFYDGTVPTGGSCALKKGVIVESENKRVDLIISEGTVAKKADGTCLDKIDIIIEPRRSNVVTFGDKEYVLSPDGASFSGALTYIYKYSQFEISDPRFLYGAHNWEDLITRNWTAPEINYTPSGEIISPVRVRAPKDLRIAYYDQESEMYIPWDTEVDEVNQLIKAQINHFSANIPAQGCNDFAYYAIPEAFKILSGSNVSDPCDGKGEAESTRISIKKVPNDSCGKKDTLLMVTGMVSEGDEGTIDTQKSGGDLGHKWFGWGSGGVLAIEISDFKDADKEIEESNLCAWGTPYVKVRGIGVNFPYGEYNIERIEGEDYCTLFNCTAEEEREIEENGEGSSGGGSGGGGSGTGGSSSLSRNCEAVGTEIPYGVFSMKTFNNKLYIGQFAYGASSQSMLYSYPEWQQVSPGITGVTESICAMEEFNGKLYANTEAEGKVYQSSSDGSSWSKVYDSPYNIGCGLAVFNGVIYATHYEFLDFKSKISRSYDGANWENVKDVGSFVKEIIVYGGKLYVFGVKSSGQGVGYVSSDGTNWQEFNAPARFLKATVINDKLYLGSTRRTSNGKSGLWVYDGTNFNLLSEQSIETVSKPQGFNNSVFVGTSSGFKTANGPSFLMQYTGSALEKVCSFEEEGIWHIEVYNNSLYIGTWNSDGVGKLYKYDPKPIVVGNAEAESGGGFLWKPVSEGNGKLVILLPSSYTGKTNKQVYVNDEMGAYDKVANGGREHYRFPNPGSAYGTDIVVSTVMNGEEKSWVIPYGSKRTVY
jgi:hypothetical protein